MPSAFTGRQNKNPNRLRALTKAQRQQMEGEMWQEMEMEREREKAIRAHRKTFQRASTPKPTTRPKQSEGRATPRPDKIKAIAKDKDWRKYGTLTLKLAPAEIAKIRKQLCI